MPTRHVLSPRKTTSFFSVDRSAYSIGMAAEASSMVGRRRGSRKRSSGSPAIPIRYPIVAMTVSVARETASAKKVGASRFKQFAEMARDNAIIASFSRGVAPTQPACNAWGQWLRLAIVCSISHNKAALCEPLEQAAVDWGLQSPLEPVGYH